MNNFVEKYTERSLTMLANQCHSFTSKLRCQLVTT